MYIIYECIQVSVKNRCHISYLHCPNSFKMVLIFYLEFITVCKFILGTSYSLILAFCSKYLTPCHYYKEPANCFVCSQEYQNVTNIVTLFSDFGDVVFLQSQTKVNCSALVLGKTYLTAEQNFIQLLIVIRYNIPTYLTLFDFSWKHNNK